MILTTLLLALAAAQAAPAPPAPPAPQAELVEGNGIYVVVNEEALTRADLFADMTRNGLDTGATAKERQRLFVKSFDESVRSMLMVQAGRDLGFDEQLVERMVADDMRTDLENAGSAISFGAMLKREQLDPQQLSELRERTIYKDLWGGSINGQYQGAGGRPYVDRYVRPGRIRYEYERQPAAEIFPPTIQLQELGISVAKEGGATQAKQLVDALRERALAGEDFSKLVETYSVAPSRAKAGLWPETPVDQVARQLPELAAFVATAKAGDVSEPLSVRPEGDLVGFILVRVARVQRRDDPRPDAADVQAFLRRRRLAALSEYRREMALGELLDGAYVWPEEAAGRRREAAPQPQPEPEPEPAPTPAGP